MSACQAMLRNVRRATIHDVAEAAGVSRGTVSRVLNGGRYVSGEALAAVRRALETTGYVANRNARNLVMGRAGAVAFVLCEPEHCLFEDPNFARLFGATTQALAVHAIPLLLVVAGTRKEQDRAAGYLLDGHVDGALVVSPRAGDTLILELVRNRFPVVVSGKPVVPCAGVPFAAAEDRGGARSMVRFLLDQGRRHIGIITGPLGAPGSMERLAGYREEVGERFRAELVIEGPYTREGGAIAMADMLAVAPELDAVFVASDLMAVGALATLAEAGRRVPDDVAVGGFDDSIVAATACPPLTTVRQPLDALGGEMVRLLLECLRGRQPEPIVLETELIRRQSA